jgi:hypothetical protein
VKFFPFLAVKEVMGKIRNSNTCSDLAAGYPTLKPGSWAFILYACLLTLLLPLPLSAATTVPTPKSKPSPCVAGTDPFKEIRQNLKSPDHACSANINAQLESEKNYPCQKIWLTIGDKVSAYETKKAANCTKINAAMGINGDQACGGTKNQKECYLNLAKRLDEAGDAENALATELESAQEEIDELIKLAEEARAKYLADQNQISRAMEQADKKIADLNSQRMLASRVGDDVIASELRVVANAEVAKKQTASGITGLELEDAPVGQVKATTGATQTLNQYSSKIPILASEQEQAASIGSDYKEVANETISRHKNGATSWKSSATEMRNRANNSMLTAGVAPEKSGTTSTTGTSQMGNGSDQGIGSGPDTSGANSPSPSSGGGMPQIPQIPGLGGGSGSSAGTTAQPDSSFMDSTKSSVASTKLGNSGQSNKKEVKSTKGGSGSPNFEGVPDGAKSVGEGGFYGSGSSSSSDQSFAKKAQDANGATSRGVDSSGASSSATTGGSERALSSEKKGAQNLKDFEANLNSGGVGIAGSEIASTFDDLSNEFGLNGEPLTEEEKAAFASLDGVDSSDTSLASSEDGVGQRESSPLFFRAKGAHERALKRGNLMITVKTRL